MQAVNALSIPSGAVTFLFTDVEGSTRLWDNAPDSMRLALGRHDQLLRSTIEAHDGYVFATGGDGFAVAFNRAGNALAAAISAQSALENEVWPPAAHIRVRMGLHSGEAEERAGDYFGTTVNRAARLMATAHGGQIVCSRSTADLAQGEFELLSLGEHRLRDLAAAEQVFQIGSEVFPPLRSVDAVPTNLPTTRTELLGRGDEVSGLVDLVTQERLVTLTGVGGVGKTRLALGVAAAVAPAYADGCWLVDLAPVAEGFEVLLATAAAMRAPVTDADGLVSYLSDRRMFVVLDNCEHVIGDAADLIDALMEATDDIHVIATSREPLGLDGEVVRRVESLGVANDGATVDQALTAPAVHLFVERAVAVSDRFTFDEGTVGAVVEICRRLDGIPLAIELAAARIRSMPAEDISRRLDERFRLLGSGSRRAQERHRTLTATVSWSHDLLTVAERDAFRRSAVFPASFSLDAAEAVVGQLADRDDAVTCLLSLVDKSLLQFDAETGRYRLLETLRQFASDRLADSGETTATIERHSHYYLNLVNRQAPRFLDQHYLSALNIVVPEVENIRAAAAWCVDQANWQDLGSLCQETLYFSIQASPVDGIMWREQLLAHRGALDAELVVQILGELSYLEVLGLGQYETAMDHANEAVALAGQEDVPDSPWAWAARCHSEMQTGHIEDSLTSSRRALQIADAVGEIGVAVVALNIMANALISLGQREQGEERQTDAMQRAEACGHPVHIGTVVINSAASYLTAIDSPSFESSLEALVTRPEVMDVGGTNGMWLDLLWGWTLLGLGRSDAVDHLVRAAITADQMNTRPVADIALRLLAVCFAERGFASESITLLRYVETYLQPYRFTAPGVAWVEERIDRTGIVISQTGPPVARSEVMALVVRVASSISQQERGLDSIVGRATEA